MLLIDEELVHLRGNDLEQRYANSRIAYDGEILTCEAMISRGDGVYADTAENGRIHIDWRKLNLYRPPARYVQSGKQIVYLQGSPKRQWHRGWVEGATYHAWKYTPGPAVRNEYLREWIYGEPVKKQRLDALPGEPIILSPQMMACEGDLYFRKRKIASVDKVCNLWAMEFEEEVKEIFPTITIKECEAPKKRSMAYADLRPELGELRMRNALDDPEADIPGMWPLMPAIDGEGAVWNTMMSKVTKSNKGHQVYTYEDRMAFDHLSKLEAMKFWQAHRRNARGLRSYTVVIIGNFRFFCPADGSAVEQLFQPLGAY